MADEGWSGYCGDPTCPWVGPDRSVREDAGVDLALHEAMTGHRTLYAGSLRPGMCVVNPLYDGEGGPEVLDVLHVSAPDADGAVIISAVGGQVRLAADWAMEPHTRERADLVAALVMEAQHDERASNTGSSSSSGGDVR